MALVLAMVEGGSKGRGSRGRGASSRGRGRGAEPPPPRPPRREETPAHNHEPAADADGIVADDEEYLALATSITNMMRDEVACRDKLLKRVSDLESALTAAQHGEKMPTPRVAGSAPAPLQGAPALDGLALPGAGDRIVGRPATANRAHLLLCRRCHSPRCF